MAHTLTIYLVVFLLGAEAESSVEQLVKRLQHKDEKIRIHAAKALAQLGSKAKVAVPAIAEALKDKNVEVRLYAALALAKLGPDAKGAVRPLIAAYYKENGAPLSRMRLALVCSGKSAIPALIEDVKDKKKEPNTRIRALQVLQDMRSEAATAIPTLTETLKDKDKGVALHSAMALASIDPNNQEAIALLVDTLKQPLSDGDELDAAVGLIPTKRRKLAVPVLTRALAEGWKHKRERYWGLIFAVSVIPLWQIGPDAKEAVPILMEYMNKLKSEGERGTAIFPAGVLLKIEPENREARALLVDSVRNLSDFLLEDELFSLFAIDVLGRLGQDAKQAIPALQKALDSENPEVRKAAREALRKIQAKQ